MQKTFEKYIGLAWRTLVQVVSALARFAYKVLELILHFAFDVLRGIGVCMRGIGWLLLGMAAMIAAAAIMIYFVATVTDLSASPTFQEMRELVLQESLLELKEDIARKQAWHDERMKDDIAE